MAFSDFCTLFCPTQELKTKEKGYKKEDYDLKTPDLPFYSSEFLEARPPEGYIIFKISKKRPVARKLVCFDRK